MLYSVALVSTVRHHESAVSMHVSLPSGASLAPSLLGHHRAPGWTSITQQLPTSCTRMIFSITWLLISLTCVSLIILSLCPFSGIELPGQTLENGASPEVQWLGLHTSTVAGMSLIPGWGTEVLLFYFVAKNRKISK